MEKEEHIENKKISKHDFYFELSLYKEIKLSEFEEDILKWEVDGYSSINHIDTTYEISTNPNSRISIQRDYVISNSVIEYEWFIKITLKCKRKENDYLYFFIFVTKDIVVKIWQFPSLADIQYSGIWKKYDKILPKWDLKNFKKAIWLNTHWSWAWFFVYLRRIFEDLIFNTYKENKSTLASISEKDFLEKKMMEKVEFLKDFLPSQLVEMKSIYWIMSIWVHELSEEDCLKYFLPIKLSIELILNQKIEIQKKKDRDEEVKKTISSIIKEIKES